MTTMSENQYLTTRQAAALLGVSLGTVQQMVENGALQAWKTVGGHRRILASSVDSYLSNRQPNGGVNSSFDIIVAEDDPTLQRLYKLTMEKWGLPLHLRMVDNGFDGLVQVGKAVPNILIADLMMPGMDGFEMIRRLRANPELAGMDIIVVSAMGPAEIEEAGGLPEDVTIYGKPIPFHEIKGFIQARLATRHRTR